MTHSTTHEVSSTMKSCPICLEDVFATEKIFTTPCGHTYHAGCMRLLKQKRCPMCRHELPNLSIVEEPMVVDDFPINYTSGFGSIQDTDDPNCDSSDESETVHSLYGFNEEMYAYIREEVSDLVT